MKELVEFIVKQLVSDPDSVNVAVEEETINITVSKAEMGRIIGKQGRIAKAIRTIVKASAAKDGKKYSVEILEAE